MFAAANGSSPDAVFARKFSRMLWSLLA